MAIQKRKELDKRKEYDFVPYSLDELLLTELLSDESIEATLSSNNTDPLTPDPAKLGSTLKRKRTKK